MKFEGIFVRTQYYRVNFEVEEEIIENFCYFLEISKEEFLQNLEEYAHDFGMYYSTYYPIEDFHSDFEEEFELFSPELKD